MGKTVTHDTERVTTGDACNLVQRHGTFGVERRQGVATLCTLGPSSFIDREPTHLVIGREQFVLLVNVRTLALSTHDNPVLTGRQINTTHPYPTNSPLPTQSVSE